jgi:hypothetical protein
VSSSSEEKMMEKFKKKDDEVLLCTGRRELELALPKACDRSYIIIR